MTDFDPARHRVVQAQRWFEDFTLGERFVIPSRTQTSAVFAAFQTASGDTHPIHYDVEYCRARGMPDLLAHGFQTLVHTAPGAGLFPYIVEESLVGFLEQSSRFLKPVYAGDTIYPALEVTELVPGRTTGVVVLKSTVFNQRREVVLEEDGRPSERPCGQMVSGSIPPGRVSAAWVAEMIVARQSECSATSAGRKTARKLRLLVNSREISGLPHRSPCLT